MADYRNDLFSIMPEDIRTIEDARTFIDLLNKYQCANWLTDHRNKEKSNETDKNEEYRSTGMYEDKYHFIYELIQNADDANRRIVSETNQHSEVLMDIDFQFKSDNKSDELCKIILTYHEPGFTPSNIISICGYSNSDKVNAKGFTIGEKGLGFKSVFTFAKKVLIESCLFSFELSSKYRTVPVKKYDDSFEPLMNKTRLTLYVNQKDCEEIFKEMKNRYSEDNAVILRNPILFLKNIKTIKINHNGEECIRFDVDRTNLQDNEGVIKLTSNRTSKPLECYYFGKHVEYGDDLCLERYGNEIQISDYNSQLLELIIPKDDFIICKQGALYTFLPTSVKLNVPFVINAPFKLVDSREYATKNDNNMWYEHTKNELCAFVADVYKKLGSSEYAGTNIVRYLPKYDESIFKSDDNGNNHLANDNDDKLIGKYYCDQKIFLTKDGSQKSVKEIKLLSEYHYTNEIFDYLDESEYNPLFEIIDSKKMKQYGCSENQYLSTKYVLRQLFVYGFKEHTDKLDKLLSFFEEIKLNDTDYTAFVEKIFDYNEKYLLTKSVVNSLIKHNDGFTEKLLEKIYQYSRGYGKYNRLFVEKNFEDTEKYIVDYVKKLEPTNSKSDNGRYESVFVTNVKGKIIYSIDCNCDRPFAILCNDAIILTKNREFSSLKKLAEYHGCTDRFKASLVFKQESHDLDNAANVSDEEYFDMLYQYRKRTKDDLHGDKDEGEYHNIISRILETTTNDVKFIDELLQNADDCKYELIKGKNEQPTFTIEFANGILKTVTNEDGFTKDNLRAITGLCESSKAGIQSSASDEDTTGSKGVGFKTAFKISNSVSIYSRTFNFSLSSEVPTVPNRLEPKIDNKYTIMEFELNENGKEIISENFLSSNDLISHCLCLRNLRKIVFINEGKRSEITIEDDGRSRIIKTTDCKSPLIFERISGDPFELKSFDLPKYQKNKKRPDKKTVVCYVPTDDTDEKFFRSGKSIKRYLYSTLPTGIITKIPMIIDAPLWLSTDRQDVLVNEEWNREVVGEIFRAIRKVINKKCNLGLSLLKYYNKQIFDTKNKLFNFDPTWTNFWKSIYFIQTLYSDKKISLNECDDKRCLILRNDYLELLENTEYVKIFKDLIIDRPDDIQKEKLKQISDNCIEVEHELNTNQKSLMEFYSMISSIAEDESRRDDLYRVVCESPIKMNIIRNSKILPVFYNNTKSEMSEYSDDIYYLNIDKDEKDALEIASKSYKILDPKVTFEIYKNLISNEIPNPLTSDLVYTEYIKQLLENIRKSIDDDSVEKIDIICEFEKHEGAFFVKDAKNAIIAADVHNELLYKFKDGNYYTTHKYANTDSIEFKGKFVDKFLVNQRYVEFNDKIGIKSIENIVKLNIDPINSGRDIGELEYDDLLDLLKFDYRENIVKNLKDNIKLFGISKNEDKAWISEEYNAAAKKQSAKDVFKLLFKIEDGFKKNIPCLRISGNYQSGPVYYYDHKEDLKSEFLKEMVADTEYEPLAKVLYDKDLSKIDTELSFNGEISLADLWELCSIWQLKSDDSCFDSLIKFLIEKKSLKLYSLIEGCSLESVKRYSDVCGQFKEFLSPNKEQRAFVEKILSLIDEKIPDSKNMIPFEMLSGTYKAGYKYKPVENNDYVLKGEIFKHYLINDVEIANLLGIEPISKLTKEVIEKESNLNDDLSRFPIDVLEDEDCEDLANLGIGHENLFGIINFLKEEELISDEQIEKYKLTHRDVIIGDEEVLPDYISANLDEIRRSIDTRWQKDPNNLISGYKCAKNEEYVNKLNFPQYLSMYNKDGRMICQMCKKNLWETYLIEPTPLKQDLPHGWEELSLNLCPVHSKKYKMMVSDPNNYASFVRRIRAAEIRSDITKIPFGWYEIKFISEHLAAIQEILRLEDEERSKS